MTKLLKPYTIIPPEYYVKRDADRQLQNIISDMGRPGYVLVSRQMGKTNLLLNAKREAETPDDIFVYIDLSNPFSSAKDCFENIIDTIIEINENKVGFLEKEIKSSRLISLDTPPHKQHTQELRKIIRSIKGKVVIILDEIDALTKTKYSDLIFSQIRSIYFTRVNFPELERLTYILSGVVEPSEIIKDSKISPFNIGQKIFLNDFEFHEFVNLTKNANLNLSDEILLHIYGWTNGNPRITWDVCSEVENIGVKQVTIEIIDKIINDLYLISYDKPPIDNIRELIKTDSELRNAIIEIEYGKGDIISDRIKSKLYLSGIINYTNGSVKIKNEIIKKSLNLNWINSLEEEEKGILVIATENFSKGEYELCLSHFEKYLENDEFPNNISSRYYYYMGRSAFHIGKPELSLKYLKLTNFDIEDNAIFYYTSQNLMGISYLNTKNYELSLDCFNSVLKRNKKDEIFAMAIMNIAYISLQSDNILSIGEAKKIFLDVVEEKSIDPSQIELKLLNEFKTISYYNLAKLFEKESNFEKADNAYLEALKLSQEGYKPRIILDIIQNETVDSFDTNLIEELVKLIKLLSPRELNSMSPINYGISELKEALLVLYRIKNTNFFSIAKDSFGNFKLENFGDLLYELAFLAMNKKLKLQVAIDLFNEIYLNKEKQEYEINEKTFYNALRLLAFFKTPENDNEIVEEYISYFSNKNNRDVDFIDIENFSNYIDWLIEKKKYDYAIKHIRIINSYKKDVPEQYLLNYIVIHNHELKIYTSLGNLIKIKETAAIILEMANNPNISKYQNTILGKEGLSVIKSNAETVLAPKNHRNISFTKTRQIGRNEMVKVKYKDGKEINIKYKKIEEDLKNEKCILIN